MEHLFPLQAVLVLLTGCLGLSASPIQPTSSSRSATATGSAYSTCDFQNGEQRLEYAVGDRWEVRVGSDKEQQCLDCSCSQAATVQCIPSELKCPDTSSCKNLQQVRNACCPECLDDFVQAAMETVVIDDSHTGHYSQSREDKNVKDCLHAGKLYSHGQRWFPEANSTAVRAQNHEQCVQCDCQMGQTICYLNSCTFIPCSSPLVTLPDTDRDSCCPVCPTDKDNAVRDREKDPTGYENPLDKDKDEQDNTVCISGEESYEEGAQWQPFIPPFGLIKCVTCQCQLGQIRCRRTECPSKPSCSNPVSVAGQCCPLCQADSNEIVNVTGYGSHICLAWKDYLVYEHLKGETVQLALRLPEDRVISVHSWTVNDLLPERPRFSSKSMKVSQFRRSAAVHEFRLLGTASPRRVGRFVRRLTKIRQTCRQGCSRRLERLVQMLRIQSAEPGAKRNCHENSRSIDTTFS